MKVPNRSYPSLMPSDVHQDFPNQFTSAYMPPPIVLTGGTAGSCIKSGQAHLLEALPPGVSSQDQVVYSVSRFSEDMTPADWVSLAEDIRSLHAQSVIVVHGTDTMSWTAAALSFLLGDLDLKVIMTGASLPPEHPESDWLTNLELARQAAKVMPDGVWVAFRGQVHRGTRVHKQSSPEVFQSLGVDAAAHQQDGVLKLKSFIDLPRLQSKPVPKISLNVKSIRLCPGTDLDYLFAIKDLQGLVVELYPSGTASETVTHQMINLHGQGILVAACIPNALPDCAYPSTQQLQDAGIPIIQDLPLHTLAVKSMWALGQASSMVKTVELLSCNIVGEQLN